jgi:hypothetical protein
MEREPLTPEAETLWRRLWEIWQENDEGTWSSNPRYSMSWGRRYPS